MSCLQECSKKEVTVHFTREGTFHRGHRLLSLSSVLSTVGQKYYIDMTQQNFGKPQIKKKMYFVDFRKIVFF